MSDKTPPPPNRASIPHEAESEALRCDPCTRIRGEDSAAEPSQEVRLALEAVPDGVVVIDSQWRFRFANRRAMEIVDSTDLVGHDIFELFPGNAEEPFNSVYRNTMATRESSEFEAFNGPPLNAWFRVQAKPHTWNGDDGIIVFFRDVTEDRKRIDIVRAQLDLLQTVQAAAHVATWELNVETGVFTWGPRGFPVFGHPFDEVQTFQQIQDHALPGYAAKLDRQVERLIREGGTIQGESAFTAKDGATVWVESRARIFAAPDGLRCLRGLSIDVTQRHLDQVDRVQSEARYRVLADLNPHALWMGDAQGHITYANQGLMSYVGLTPADLGATGWLEAVWPGERERFLEIWNDSVRTGTDYNIEAPIRNALTGEYRYWNLRAAPVRDASGAILHWLGVGQDIHDTKTYTAALRAQQAETERRRAELETLYSTSPIGLALFDPVDLTFLNLNEFEAQMLGAPRERLLGKPLAAIASPEKIPQLFELMRIAASGIPVRNQLLEGELTVRPGERRYWNVNYSPIFNEDGSVRAISTASIEVTQQKRAEAALIQSEKLAAVGRLASSISHEINNPLEAITNLLYLISLDDKLPASLGTYVNLAQSELSRVSQIATQTLRFHRQAVAPTLVTPAELVGAVVRLYTGRLANSKIEVDARYLTGTGILCFENDIRQVLNNLIANAIDAMRTGGRLLIRAHEAHLRRAGDDRAAARSGVRITIADTGHGMSPATIARVFEPFFTTKDLNGTGLGLWISTGIVERHRGSLRVRSSDRPGRNGTVFTLFLPREEEPAAHT